MNAVKLRTEHLKNPIGIDIVTPRLSWNCEGGKEQTAYEVEAFCEKELFWSSGKVQSNEMSVIMKKSAESKKRVTWKVRLWDEKEEVGEWSEEAFYEMGILDKQLWKAKWVNPELECDPQVHKPASYLKRTFSGRQTDCGRMYVTAHGLYEAYLNGKRVGEFVLAPGTYNYDKRIAYQTYDISGLLTEGENTVEVILGDGWYRSVSGVDGDRNLYGTDVALFLQIEADGEVLCISDEKWVASQEGEIRENDMQQGEVIDARMLTEGGTVLKEDSYHAVKTEDYGVQHLCCSNAVPIREKERFAGKVIQTPDGRTVLDFGQNLAGYLEISLEAHVGEQLLLTHGEMLDENGNFTQENFQDRKRHKEGGTKQQINYICKEGENFYKSKFCIFGFRYALLEGNIDVSKLSVTAIAVYSDMQELTSFSCGNEDANRLFLNCLWSMKSNFCDVPTDCPTRERAAWTGDMGVFIDTGLYLMDSYSVVRKWLTECRLTQYEDGKLANISPKNSQPGFFSGLLAGSVGWGDASIIVPYAMYKRTGDRSILEENYEMMKKWYEFLVERAKKKPMNPMKRFKRNPYRAYTIETGVDYGEWCEPDVESTNAMRTPQVKVATAYFARSGQLLAEIAEILGKTEDVAYYKEYAENAKEAFRFLALKDGKLQTDRQAEVIRAITFDLLTDSEKNEAAALLNELVIKNEYHLNTGFLSTPKLCEVLTAYGYRDTAYRLLLQDTAPSWLYAVRNGATTIWEEWSAKASLNHYSKGAIANFIISQICGIKIENGKITLAPQPDERLEYAQAVYDSPYGKISSRWKYDGNELSYYFSIPSNMMAELILKDGRKMILKAGDTIITGEI